MNTNDFYSQSYNYSSWGDFTLDDERRARSRFSRFFLSTAVFLVVAQIAAIALELILLLIMGEGSKTVLESSWYVWGANVFALYIVAFPILYLIVRRMQGAFRTKYRMPAKEFLILFVIGQSLMTIGGIIGTAVNGFIGALIGRDITDTTSDLIENSPLYLILIVAVIIGPIIEELIFRKLLMDKLGMYGDRLAIIVSAVSFGLFHGNLYQFFYAAMLGALLAYMYSRTSNVWYPIAMHMLMNFFGSIIPMLLSDSVDKLLELQTLIESGAQYDVTEYTRVATIVGGYSLFQYGMLFAGIMLMYKLRRRFFVTDRCEILIPKERRASLVLLNPGSIIFLVVVAATMVLNIIFA
ncbi:MAG: CPBP family intramembrane metalloprotease [Ruminococcaceae bacterium]|nr:CPBP family intramembrane metalloprotease [Oscillospiraceae bacterium]